MKKKGFLSDYFIGVASKELSAVEADVLASNQHEFNGVDGLKKIFGEAPGKQRFNARFLYLTDNEPEPVQDEGFLTWYDARARARVERGVMRSEYRLYFPSNLVAQLSEAGDTLYIAKSADDLILAIVAEADTTIARQIEWLFGFGDRTHPGFSVREELEGENDRIEFASRFILEKIGIEVELAEESFLEEMLNGFDGKFPKTKDFSTYARSTLSGVSPRDDADDALMAWMEREEVLFRTLEKHFVSQSLDRGFDSTEHFIAYSLSVQNRRKSRAGLALENHVEAIFQEYGIRFTRAATTEGKSKPDFIFPSQREYLDLQYPSALLTMLGVKSTCKDRWRQVLVEAARIENKHLLTLEAAISPSQTREMISQSLQLVVPSRLHHTFNPEQRDWLIDFNTFIDYVVAKQMQ